VNRTATANGSAAPAVEARPNPMPRTRFPEVWGLLALPFRPEHIKILSKSGRQMPYVTARTVMNRLDFALGPENWWDEYRASEHSVECRLSIRLPDGSVITKADAGGMAGMSDPGDDDKSGYSDAFKRAAVKFGVGRHLYGDGVVSYPKDRPPPTEAPQGQPGGTEPTPEPPASEPVEASPRAVPSASGEVPPVGPKLNFVGREWIQGLINEYEADWAAFCKKEKKPHEPLVADIWQACNAVLSMWVELDPREAARIEVEGVRKKGLAAARLGQAYKADPALVQEDFRLYLDHKWGETATALGVNLDAQPPEEAPSNG
jgi:hypothetical protein